MTTLVRMPQLGESIVEGTVARWLKAPGDAIDKLEPLLEVSTDKIDTEIPSPSAGVLLDIVVPEGQTVATGTVLAHIGAAGQKVERPANVTAADPAAEAQKITASSHRLPRVNQQNRAADKPTGRDFISPIVAKIACEHAVELSQVAGSGMNGRVTKKDVLAYIDSLTKLGRSPTVEASNVSETDLQPLTAMRKAIAAHMVQSKATSPHVTTIFEVDMTAVVQHREAHKNGFASKGIALTFTPYFVAATVDALRQVPAANAQFQADGLLLHQRIHLGVAVALRDGLIVPVLRDADEKNLHGLARSISDLAQRARNGTLSANETQGGTFTVTNHGVSGSLIGTPIINQPQAGILGIGAIVKRPVVLNATASLLPSADDMIAIRPMCYLNFTFDHRILDGATADKFLSIIKQKLEKWSEQTNV